MGGKVATNETGVRNRLAKLLFSKSPASVLRSDHITDIDSTVMTQNLPYCTALTVAHKDPALMSSRVTAKGNKTHYNKYLRRLYQLVCVGSTL